MTFKVGDKVFIFDENRRIYALDRKGSPVYREHFREVKIVGETCKSWLVHGSYTTKYSKKTCQGLYTAEQVEDEVWKNEHRHRIVSDIKYKSTPKQLREIAKIIGYKP